MYTWNSFEEYNFWNSDYKPGGLLNKCQFIRGGSAPREV